MGVRGEGGFGAGARRGRIGMRPRMGRCALTGKRRSCGDRRALCGGNVLGGEAGNRAVEDVGPTQVGDERDQPEPDRRRQSEQDKRGLSRPLKQSITGDAVPCEEPQQLLARPKEHLYGYRPKPGERKIPNDGSSLFASTLVALSALGLHDAAGEGLEGVR